MGNKTALYDCHVQAGARMVDFGGWDMPLHYGSQLEEHHHVRRDAGVFDVSHMTVVDVTGPEAAAFLRELLANDIARLEVPGKALYSCMLNEHGGVVDDLIVYYVGPEKFRMVVNAATREKDLHWIATHVAGRDVSIREHTELAMIAVQGPEARRRAADVIAQSFTEQALAIKPFHSMQAGDLFIARTGYTGEDGWEIMLPAEQAADAWRRFLAAGIRPAGLGARDTLRLEAGMNLYGTDMDETVSPLATGLGWTIAWDPADRQFIGRDALSRLRGSDATGRFCGLLLEGKGILRNHMRVVIDNAPDGEITSGGFSPTLQRSIAMARLPGGRFERVQVDMRGRLADARVVELPFVRNGAVQIEV